MFLDYLPDNVCDLPGANIDSIAVVNEQQLFYTKITIDQVALSRLPKDGVTSELSTVNNWSEPTDSNKGTDQSDDDPASTHSFLSILQSVSTVNP